MSEDSQVIANLVYNKHENTRHFDRAFQKQLRVRFV